MDSYRFVLFAAGSTSALAHFFLMLAWRTISGMAGWKIDWPLQFLRDLKGVEISVTLLVAQSRPGAHGDYADPRFFAWIAELQGFQCFAQGCNRHLSQDLEPHRKAISTEMSRSKSRWHGGLYMWEILCLILPRLIVLSSE